MSHGLSIEIQEGFHGDALPVLEESLREPVRADQAGPAAATLIAREYEGGPVLGASLLRRHPDGHNLWLLAVRPGARRQGVGSALLRFAEKLAREAGAPFLKLRTNREDYPAMEPLLRKAGWVRLAFVAAKPGRAVNTGIEERWFKPLPPSPAQILLCGFGGRGREWAERVVLRPDWGAITAVVDENPEARLAARDRGLAAFPTVREAARTCASPCAAILAVHHHAYGALRQELREAFSSSGRPAPALLQEKPLDIELLPALAACDYPAPLLLGVQRRAHPSYLYLRRLVEQAAERGVRPSALVLRAGLGRPAAEASTGFRGDYARAGGGVLIDLGYHLLDLVPFLLGTPPEPCSVSLSREGRPCGAGDLETRACVSAFCGDAAVRVLVDRRAPRHEDALLEFSDGARIWAGRQAVHRLSPDDPWPATGEAPSGPADFACDQAWRDSEIALLGLLSLSAQGLGASGLRRLHLPPDDHWADLATLRIVERARVWAQGALSGWWP